MTNALDNAALAFDTSMGRAPARSAPASKTESNEPPEAMFGNLGEMLDGSDDTAGGDDEEDEIPAKPSKEVEEDDEDEGDDEGADDEDDELSDEEKEALKADKDEDEDDELMNQEFEVMVDGVEKKVKLKEALDGYIRMDTFHQRLNQLSEVKQTVIAEAQQVVADRQKYTGMLKEAETILGEMMPAEPDWDAEFAKDGVRANALRKQYDMFKGKVQEIKTKREAAEREAHDAHIRDTTTFAQNEYPKFARAAGWKSKEDQVRDTKSMRKTALALGFSEEEVGAVYDSRLLQVLLKASKYDRMMASRPKPVQKNGKVQQIPSGAGRNVSRTAPKGANAAMSRLNKTGSIDDAASVFDQILSNSSRKRNR